ncbi:MAG: methyltransferase domain-containing protein [Thiobacillaceae bacterium]|jgi:ubiquinone/menaquinone biosynthesis C-methylase UbiE
MLPEQLTQYLDDYQQRVAAIHVARAHDYDSTPGNTDWHRRIAALLVQRAPLRPGRRVLDIATGTGPVASNAAARAGPQGEVLGIGITACMLEQVRAKARASRLGQVRVELADAENLVCRAHRLTMCFAVPR